MIPEATPQFNVVSGPHGSLPANEREATEPRPEWMMKLLSPEQCEWLWLNGTRIPATNVLAEIDAEFFAERSRG